jgi:hypothetical protein
VGIVSLGLKLVNGDLSWSKGALETISTSLDATRQLLETRLRMARGEWFLDPEEGLPVYEKILGKPRSETGIRQAIRECILETPGIEDVLSMTVSIDRSARTVLVQFVAQATEGEIVMTTEIG